MQQIMNRAVLGALAVVGSLEAMPALALAGPDWVELGDAGSNVNNAQQPRRPNSNTRQLDSIAGRLDASRGGLGDFEDLYFIRIEKPTAFSLGPTTANFNPVMYLFNLTLGNEAFGLLANDDRAPGDPLPLMTNLATDGTQARVTQPGDYLIAIAGRGRTPFSRSGDIFEFDTDTEVSGADGPGGLNPLEGWRGSGETGDYIVTLTGSDFPAVPAPGVAGMLALGGIGLTRRRR